MMLENVAPISALLLGVAMLQLGNGLQGTLLPVRAQIEAFTQLELGALGSAYFFGFAVGCYFGPSLVRSSGHIRTFAAMVALASALVLTHPLVVDPAFWLLVRAASGVCFAVLYMVIESWLNARSTKETRGLVIAATAFLSIVAGLAMSLFGTDTGRPALVLTGVFGFLSFPLYMLCVAHTNDSVEHDGFVEAANGLLLIWGPGAVVGPLIASNVIVAVRLGELFYATAALHAILLAFTLYRISQREARSVEESGEFLDAVRVGQTVSTVDPLAHDDEQPPEQPPAPTGMQAAS